MTIMMEGLSLLGAVMPAEHKKMKAAEVGRRATAAAARIARSAPKLAAAVAAAGQRLLAKAGVAKPTMKTAAKPAAKAAAKPAAKAAAKPAAKVVVRPADGAGRGLAALRAASQAAQPRKLGARPMTGPPQLAPAGPSAPAFGKGRARVGEDSPPDAAEEGYYEEPSDLRDLDIYTALGEAAVRAADFVAEIQDLMAKLPPGVKLIPQGQNILDTFQFLFASPIEKALSGETGVTQWTDGLLESLQHVLNQRSDNPPVGVWAWVAQVNAYLRLHPPAQPSPGQVSPGQAPPSGGPVARVVVTPSRTTFASGTPVVFSAQAFDASGAAVTPKAPPVWSASAGATIDQAGNLTATQPGTYTVTASVDGVQGMATATAQAGAPPGGQPPPSQPPPQYQEYGPPPQYQRYGYDDQGHGYDDQDGDDYLPSEDDGGVMDAYYEEQADAEGGGAYEDLEEFVGHRGGRGGGRHYHHQGGRGWRGGLPFWYGAAYEVPVFELETDDGLTEAAEAAISEAELRQLLVEALKEVKAETAQEKAIPKADAAPPPPSWPAAGASPMVAAEQTFGNSGLDYLGADGLDQDGDYDLEDVYVAGARGGQ